MSESERHDGGILVPVADTSTANETVRYAVETYEGADFHFVSVVSSFQRRESRKEEAENLLEKARVWAEETETDASVRFEVLETNGYLFGPGEHAEVFAEYAEKHDTGRIVLDPGYRVSATSPILQPLKKELRGYEVLEFEEAPIDRPRRRSPLLTRGGASRFATVFILSYGFYLALGSFSAFDIVTGGITAAVVAVTLQRVSFQTSPTVRRVPGLGLRLLLYAPFLLWQIVVANFRIAYVVLHPDLPIDPSIEEFEAGVWGGAAVTTLANSITLTPGTLTVEADGRRLHVHSLTESAREGLLEGSLERGVRFVFYGRKALDYPKPKERGGDEDD